MRVSARTRLGSSENDLERSRISGDEHVSARTRLGFREDDLERSRIVNRTCASMCSAGFLANRNNREPSRLHPGPAGWNVRAFEVPAAAQPKRATTPSSVRLPRWIPTLRSKLSSFARLDVHLALEFTVLPELSGGVGYYARLPSCGSLGRLAFGWSPFIQQSSTCSSSIQHPNATSSSWDARIPHSSFLGPDNFTCRLGHNPGVF